MMNRGWGNQRARFKPTCSCQGVHRDVCWPKRLGYEAILERSGWCVMNFVVRVALVDGKRDRSGRGGWLEQLLP